MHRNVYAIKAGWRYPLKSNHYLTVWNCWVGMTKYFFRPLRKYFQILYLRSMFCAKGSCFMLFRTSRSSQKAIWSRKFTTFEIQPWNCTAVDVYYSRRYDTTTSIGGLLICAISTAWCEELWCDISFEKPGSLFMCLIPQPQVQVFDEAAGIVKRRCIILVGEAFNFHM